MYFRDSYFHLLSNEILIKILKHINTYDLLQFGEAYNSDELLSVYALVRNINFSKCYKLRNLEPLRKVNLCYIKTVNINGLYWLEENYLRSFLCGLENLENLFAIHTVLDIREKDLLMYHQLKLKQLAISVNSSITDTKIQLPTVETLFLKLFSITDLPLFQIFPGVKALWIEESTIHWRPESCSIFPEDLIQKLMYKAVNCIRASKSPEYRSLRDGQYTLFFDLINIPEKIENIWPQEWKIFKKFPPYRFSTLYALKEKNIDDIMLDELNFNNGKCSTEYFEAIKKILSSPNTKYLKKLSIKLCYFHYVLCCMREEEKQKQDVECCNLDGYFLGNLKDLEVLELYECSCTKLPTDFFDNFSIISQLKYLKYLLFKLHAPRIDSGQFLIEILKNCQQLEKLTITCEINQYLNIILRTALKDAKNLKDFQYTNLYFIPISEILNSFCSIENPKLERLSLFCKESEQWGLSELEILERFLSKNPQLVFLHFRDLSCNIRDLIAPILAKYREQHPAKRFFPSTYSLSLYCEPPIPKVHNDMLSTTSVVSNADIYREIEIF